MPTPRSRSKGAISPASLLRRALVMGAIGLGALTWIGCRATPSLSAPVMLRGRFVDDYGTRHVIDDTLWVHGTTNRYHVVAWDATARVLIARNDSANAADGGLYDRIDWVMLPDTDGWSWAFCIVSWNAPTEDAARAVAPADTATPRKGCGGHPFTRMRPVNGPVTTEERHDRS